MQSWYMFIIGGVGDGVGGGGGGGVGMVAELLYVVFVGPEAERLQAM